ncbi:pyridoxine kinase [Rhodoligotrophos appendicifer]|uniref:pyridoxal kinase n=1 Tax=Rhodoligotrophos appendicifer TaxID=987056 RepID=UPI00118572F1|nr:pyridoxal kinase [Rhodoligotrophos appendicifer]
MKARTGGETWGVMAEILAISSQVVRGHVGNSAVAPALQALGHEVYAVPTVLLSNHPEHGATSGIKIEAATIDAMLERLHGFGWLHGIGAVMTGYFRGVDQVEVALRHILRLREELPGLLVMTDPILGDDPHGIYVPEPVAEAIRETLLPLAHIITPNRFELAWLAGHPVESLQDARHAASMLKVPTIIVTSVPAPGGNLANLLFHEGAMVSAEVVRRQKVPQGTGDLLAGLTLGHHLRGNDMAASLSLAVSGVDTVLACSENRNELALSQALPKLAAVSAWPLIR